MAAIFFLRKPIVPCSPNIFQAELEEKRRLAAEASPAGGDSHSDVGDRSGAEALAEGAGGEKAEGSGNDSDEDPKQKFSLDLKPPSLGHSAASSRGGSQAATPLKSPHTPKPSEEFLRFQVLPPILFKTYFYSRLLFILLRIFVSRIRGHTLRMTAILGLLLTPSPL